MDIKKIIINYTRYNHWANGKMIQWLKTLDSELLYKETRSSFASIDLTLQHMNRAQNFWLTILAEGDVGELDDTIKSDAAEFIMNALLTGSQQMLATFNGYTEEDFLNLVRTDAMTQCRYDFILHMINHNSYHRGQIVTMSRGLGVVNNIPDTDYEFFLWSEC